MILIFKLLSTPLLILGLTLLSRRFGPAVGGLLMGIPLVTGPVSIFTALENGAAFARHAAIGNLVGQVSTCIFCFVYARAAKRFNCWLSMIAGVGAFFLATFVWNLATWAFVAAIGLLLVTLLLLSFLTKPVNDEDLLRAITAALEKDRIGRESRSELDEIQQRLSALTPREREVLTHVVSGQLNKQIANDLGTVEKTIKVHRARVMEKMKVNSVAELVRLTERLCTIG